MSIRAQVAARSRPRDVDERLFRWAGGAAMAAAVAWLALRPAPSFASFRTTPVLALSYVLILAAGALVSSIDDRDIAHDRAGARSSYASLLVGLTAIALARSLVAPAPPLMTTEVSAALSVLAAVAEEALFRGGVFRLLEPRAPRSPRSSPLCCSRSCTSPHTAGRRSPSTSVRGCSSPGSAWSRDAGPFPRRPTPRPTCWR